MDILTYGALLNKVKEAKPTDEQVAQAVEEWLDDHPEATTTVQDGSINHAKLDSDLQDAVDEIPNLKSQMGAKASTDMALGAYPTDSASGAVATFADGGDNLPVKDLTIGIEPVQSGSGDPSPDNVRPISGWTGANINVNGTTIPITFPTEAGMVCAGTLNVTTGMLTVTHIGQDFTGASSEGWTTSGNGTYVGMAPLIKRSTRPISSAYLMEMVPTSGNYVIRPVGNNRDFPTIAAWKAYLAQTPLQVCYQLDTPATYQLTPIEVLTLLGANTIYADTGNTTVTYRADPTLYADKRSNATRSIIAGIEPTMTASKAYSVGQLLIVGDTLYKVATSIASGATLTPGTNVNPTTVAEQLILLANA